MAGNNSNNIGRVIDGGGRGGGGNRGGRRRRRGGLPGGKPATARPSRLLNLQVSPASKKAIAATNASSSPFLKLPAEIRQRIYNYALGGHTLHGPCDYKDDTSSPSIRLESSRSLERFVEGFDSHFSTLSSHEQCYRGLSAQRGLSVQLLQTCRQIYHEAVLVPFKKNIFAVAVTRPLTSFSTSFTKFLDSLVPAQVKAISHLVLQPNTISTCTWNQMKRLEGLAVLHAATNATTSPFLRLPAEIRERVYTYVLGGQVLHVGSGPIHHPHSVVICTHLENYDEGPDGHISRFETRYPSLVQSIGKSTGHIESHSQCYNVPREQTHYSLDLLFVCRQIYHEAVLIPFEENTFAVAVSTAIPPCLPNFLDILVPAQLKAIRDVIIQHTKFTKDLRLSLSRLKGLQTLQYILVGAEDHLKEFAFAEFFEVKGKLGDYGLPPACDVRIRVRRVLGHKEAAPEPGHVERVSDELMELVERAWKQILEGSGSSRKWTRGKRKNMARLPKAVGKKRRAV